MQSWLLNRLFRVRWSSELSTIHAAAYVADILQFSRDKSTRAFQFADDTGVAIFKPMPWKINFNTRKTEAIQNGKKKAVHPFIQFNGRKIPFTHTVTYLGIKIDRKLTFLHHVKTR